MNSLQKLHQTVKKRVEHVRDEGAYFVSHIVILWDGRNIKSISSDGSTLTKYEKDEKKKDA